jgi:hypothetical protein
MTTHTAKIIDASALFIRPLLTALVSDAASWLSLKACDERLPLDGEHRTAMARLADMLEAVALASRDGDIANLHVKVARAATWAPDWSDLDLGCAWGDLGLG